MCRVLLVGAPTVAVIGALAGSWPWSTATFLTLSFALQLLLSPRQHRRQILTGRI
ncbi:MAG: hypothetical protein QOE93_1066 [Actinomycetota bacterium]|nr:hypothetical protein [Actinomycetota bacterium]